MTPIIERIPIEILVQIFRIYKESGDNLMQHLFDLSLVCRLWREVIQACPALWSDICLSLSTGKAEQQAKYQLARAGSTLLSLTILSGKGCEWDGKRKRSDSEEESARELSVRLASIFHDTMFRWKSLVMYTHLHETQPFLDNCVGYTPNLSEVTIILGNVDSNVDVVPPRLSIPVQRPAGVDSGPPVIASFKSFLPIYPLLGTSITSLDVDVRHIRARTIDLIAMLLSCPNLVQYELCGGLCQTIGEVPDPVLVPLPHLLDLRVMGFLDLEHLLGALRFEGLRSLSLDVSRYSSALQGALQSLFRTCVLLTTVHIAGCSCERLGGPLPPGPTIVLPSVKHFALETDTALHQFFRRLSLPRAQTIEIRRVPYDVAHQLMSSSPQLTSASFGEIFGALPHHTPITVLPHLTKVKIWGPAKLLGYIDAPSLSELILLNLGGRSASISKVRILIERSTPPLRKLHLMRPSLSDEDLIWCLRRLPLIEELVVTGASDVSDVTLRALGAEQDADVGVLLPHLRSATFRHNRTTADSFALLAASRDTVTWTYK
ncbi:hypothetical protein BOTBODRAFT_223885 [Botryobasidium botryosum FD-172 SS1]|uniref:F-box domain-containing protein n=1 Tax=Botryobasidium botryosum (strain FD-172 SS1) TaxID=930990 RepID=A0A067MYQ5_BOTB1|nr:hypothetical protein BOTBODRAFT_223885 [Botryobasidium botryosum FD-172 SS1]